MIRDAGYTLIETLAALAVIGLAMVGVVEGVQLLVRSQRALDDEAAASRAARDVQQKLAAKLDLFAPFRAQEPDRLSGDSSHVRFACGGAQPCALEVGSGDGKGELSWTGPGEAWRWRFPAKGRVHLVYAGGIEAGEVWPPASGRPQALRGLTLVDDGPDPVTLMKVRIWAEEPGVCAFDAVQQDCR